MEISNVDFENCIFLSNNNTYKHKSKVVFRCFCAEFSQLELWKHVNSEFN